MPEGHAYNGNGTDACQTCTQPKDADVHNNYGPMCSQTGMTLTESGFAHATQQTRERLARVFNTDAQESV